MAEKKGGFHALEKRIHQMEDEDRTQERQASGGGEQRQERKERHEGHEAPKQEPPKK